MNVYMESGHDRASARPDSKSVPVIRGFPGLGVVPQLRRNALHFFSETVKRYGDRVELRVLGRRILLLTHPADVNDVLNAPDFGRSPEVKSLRRVLAMVSIPARANAGESSGVLCSQHFASTTS
jgi:cytochrome P450